MTSGATLRAIAGTLRRANATVSILVACPGEPRTIIIMLEEPQPMAKVEIYFRDMCPYCLRADRLLASKDIEVNASIFGKSWCAGSND